MFESCFGSSKKRKINIHKLFIPLNLALISECWSAGTRPELARRCGSFCEVSESGMWCFAQWGTKKEGKSSLGSVCVCVCDPACVVNLCVFVHSIH